jgi:MEMO1 family protein
MMSPSRSNTSVREPAVAGFFYPSDPSELRGTVEDLLERGGVGELPTETRTFIVPHAGYVYSGSVAATVYSALRAAAQPIRRVVLIGPSHRVYLRGIAVPQVDAFRTPLGDIPLDMERKRALLRRGDVVLSDTPHALEHSLEVQLPFLQVLSDGFDLMPLVVGEATPEHIASVLEHIIGDAGTLVLASSDLSHYLTYEEAREKDAATSSDILAFANNLVGDQACGAVALNGLLTFAKRRRAQITELARLNSGDTAGDRSRVVGYGAYAIHDDRRS